MARDLADTLYELALHALDEQQREVSEARGRVGTLLAASAISSSVLGAPTLTRVGLSPWVIGALGLLVLAVAGALFVLWPTRMRFSLGVDVASTLPSSASSRESLTALALTIHEVRKGNEPVTELQRRGIVVVTVATALQLVAWMLALVVA